MSIADEITRLQTAKANIKAAIESKGVVVGDETIDTFAEKIVQISGELPNNISAINGGVWTQATTLGANGVLEIEHGLTHAPDIIVISSDIFDIKPTAHNLANLFYEKIASTTGYAVYYNEAITTRGHLVYGEATQGITAVDNSKFTIKTASNRILSAGVTYSWIAVSLTPGVEVVPNFEYQKGYEDGKNSVVDLGKLCKSIRFKSLNIFGAPEIILNLDNATDLESLANIQKQENKNNIVEHLTINANAIVTSVYRMFYCNNLSIDKTLKHLTLNFSLVNSINCNNMFYNMQGLEIIDGEPLDLSACTNISGMFGNCNNLIKVRFAPNSIKISISFKDSQLLSDETTQSIMDGLADLTGGTAQTLTLHKDLKILQSQVDSANAKGWTVAGGVVVSEEEYYAE